MSSSKQFSVNEFFKMSLEQYLLVKCHFVKQALEESQKNEEKKQIIQDYINEFVIFSKHIMGKNCKNPQIIIAEIIEKLLILDISLMRKKEDDFPRDILNRQFKLLLIQFDRMDLHILQLFTRLQCLKLMYEYLTVSEKVPKGFNYREKFDSDLIKHIDQIKVYTKMNFSQASDSDGPLLKIFKSLLQNCTCIEFYTFLHNFCIRNELSKEVKKYVRIEYENLRQKFSDKQISQQNQKLVQQFNDELSKSQIQQQNNNLLASNNNSNPSQLIFMEGNSQGSENFCAIADMSEENKKISGGQRQRKQFNSIFIGNKGVTGNSQQQQNQQGSQCVSQNEAKGLLKNRPQSRSQYLSSINGENSLNRLMEEENSNNISNQFAEANKIYLQQNHTDFGYQNCGINSEENTQFNLINFKGFANNNSNNVQEQNEKNTNQNNEFKYNKNNSSSPNNAFTASLKQNEINKEEQDNINQGKRVSSSSCQSGSKIMNSSILLGSTINLTNSKIVSINNQRALSKPIQSGRTMYQVQNKKILRNSQSKCNGSKQTSLARSNSKNNHLDSNNSNGTSNLLFEAASRVQQEYDQKRQAKLKLMSRESNKQSDPFSAAATKAFKTPSSQENFLEGYQNINNNHPSHSEDENSIPLMYMWGHN